ncbi:methyl-accepting chemotaxis protein [Herbaspirillum sp. alder98]|uniref:methyl-accepting chemotaxis protein n=1 Tax=Herbaspirillum sp. alder98 TaxID=2913096 RepID=UPI001CD89A3F|nr:methyl-accepting chemotaxis protein [Herbaspirillum sp. alder98]MCA1325182.1 methyl-accepting chemotaxis protein [Herbaspirillum sp. alder98]
MNNFKIGQRLGLGFAALLILLVAIAGFGLRQVSKLNDRIEFLTSVDEGKLLALSKTQFAVGLRAIGARNLVLVSTPADQKNDIALVTSAQKDIDTGIAQLATLMQAEGTSQEERQMLDQLRSLEATYLPIATRIGQLATSQQTEAAKTALINDCMPILRQVIAHIARFNDVLRANSTANVAAADEAYSLAKWTMLATSLIALLLGTAIAWLLTRSISVPLQQAVTVAQNVSAGDLSSRIVVKGRDELGQLMTALKGMNDSLQSIVGEVRHGTDTIAVASDEIKRGNMDLSARTEQQAGSLQETASAMEELTATVKQNAENAQQANQLAASASKVAVKGGDVVHRVIGTMDSISESSKKIVDIISVIDGIAFQTNILALNAAVEAARAGEQGRGFAVVASEVRSLAQRSATAAKEIKQLIDDSVTKVAAGSALVNEAGATMTEVVDSIKSVTTIMHDISAASAEQTMGIEQINRAITMIDEATQQNAALVEEAAAAAASMQEQTNSLSGLVSVFKLDDSVPLPAAANAPMVHINPAPALGGLRTGTLGYA